MSPHFEPPSPETEAANMLSAYHERLRGAELRDLNEVNLDTDSPAARRLRPNWLRSGLLMFSRFARVRRQSDRDGDA